MSESEIVAEPPQLKLRTSPALSAATWVRRSYRWDDQNDEATVAQSGEKTEIDTKVKQIVGRGVSQKYAKRYSAAVDALRKYEWRV